MEDNTMKKIYNILLSCIALMIFIPKMNADDPPYTEGTGRAEGLAYSKTIAGPENGIYTITLESFVKGEITIKQGVPADIVLVLDVSGSMNDGYGHDEYTALPSTSYSYDSYGNNQYYVLYNNQYYLVSQAHYNGTFVQDRYGLTFRVGNSTRHLEGNSSANGAIDWNTGATSATATVYTGVLYQKTQSATTRIAALKTAVGEFIDVIASNAEESSMDNKLSIVKFGSAEYYGSESSLAEGNHRGANNNNNYNYTEVVRSWTSVLGNEQSLKNSVNAIQAGGATAVEMGVKKAQYLLADGAVSRESAKTVVVFTDGVPTHGNASSVSEVEGVADDAIENAKAIKDLCEYSDANGSHNATVYTVGVFEDDTDPLAEQTNPAGQSNYSISDYMNYLSSNYLAAESLSNHGTASSDGDFYKNAANGDLSTIFRDIASASGGAGADLDASSVEAIDIVSQSFTLPENASPDDISVYYAACTGRGTDGYLTFASKDDWDPNPPQGSDGHVTIELDGNKVTATGFDYSEEWCGLDESVNAYHGHKLVLEIPIMMAPTAVGGLGVETNGPESGIYINGENLLPFKSPDVKLPTNLHIKKEGLSTGESAIFKLYRTPADDDGTPKTPVNWVHFKTVIVIEGVNEDSTVKLRGLDPNYAYKIVEDGWSWAYDTTNPLGEDGQPLTEVTSDKLITNPFIFTNTLNTKGQTIIRAESAVVNDWSSQGKQVGVDSKTSAPK